MNKKSYLKNTVLVLIITLIMNVSISPDFKQISLGNKVYAGSSRTVTFSESTSSSRSDTITITNLHSISKVSVNTGSVSHSRNGNNVTINVWGGSPRVSTESSTAYDFLYSTNNEFANFISYNINGFSGTLYKSGSSFVESGEYIPPDSKTATASLTKNENNFPLKLTYNEGNYSGELSKTGIVIEKYIPEVIDSKYIESASKDNTATRYYDINKKELFVEYSWDGTNDHPTLDYTTHDGYSGKLSKYDYYIGTQSDFTSTSYPGKPEVKYKRTQTYTGYYRGYVYKTIKAGYYEYTQNYSGTVTKPAIDSRIWRQNYSGTVYGPTTYYYSYTVTIDYNCAPRITAISPQANDTFSENSTAFTPQISVADDDGDTLTCRYYVDAETTPRDTKVISNTYTAQTVSFTALQAGGLTEGDHTVKFEVNDGTTTSQLLVGIKVDKTPPVLGTVTITSTDTGITVTGSATDSIAGLDSKPYRYTIGADATDWMSNSTFTKSSLLPNTLYFVRFEARDKHGHVAKKDEEIYTRAKIPVITLGNLTETTLEVTATENNPAGTKYQVSVGSKYVASNGELSSVAEWITLTNKKINVRGLTPNTAYNIKAKARNAVNIETAQSSQVTGTTLSLPPSDVTFTPSRNSIYVSWQGVNGATGYDIEADGITVNNGLSTSYNHTSLTPDTMHTYRIRVRNAGGTGNWSSLFSKSTLPNPPGTPTNISVLPKKTTITLSWDAPVRATAYDIEADGVIIEGWISTNYIHEGLSPDTNHSYRIRARNAGGESPWSELIEKRTLPAIPPIPDSFTTELTKSSVKIVWEQVEEGACYEVEADGMIYDTGADLYFLHENLDPLTNHRYRVRARNEAGKSAWSNAINVTTYPEEPSTPGNIMVTSDKESISLIWYDVAYAESYDVLINGTEIVNVESTECLHSNLIPDTKYTYRVRAKNISGTSEWSKPVTISTLPESIESDISLSNIAAIVTNNSIILSWDAAAIDAEYDIEVDGILKNNGDSTVYRHSGLQPESYHTYRIKVKSNDGVNEWCAVITLSTLPNPPDAPSSIEAFATNNTIELRWERVEGASGYDIEIDGEVLDNEEAFTYIHRDLKSGTSHTYRVRAKNITGVTAWSSAVIKSTTSPTYTVNCLKGKKFDLSLIASNVQDFTEIKFVITYNKDEIEISDLCGLTPEKDIIAEGDIEGTNLHVRYAPGRIEFTVNENIVPGTSWSGEITNIVFKAKKTGRFDIDITVE